jgi:hypothetical protein
VVSVSAAHSSALRNLLLAAAPDDLALLRSHLYFVAMPYRQRSHIRANFASMLRSERTLLRAGSCFFKVSMSSRREPAMWTIRAAAMTMRRCN